MLFFPSLSGLKDRIVRNLPFRVMLGRLGVHLSEIGRWLQVKYAHFNREFRLKAEHWPASFHCEFFVSEPVTDATLITFSSPDAQPGRRTPMVDALFAIQGVTGVRLKPYEVVVEYGKVFTLAELQPRIESVILEHLTARS